MDRRNDERVGRPLYLRIPISLRADEDKDIIDFLDGLGRGNVSPWLRETIRARMAGEDKDGSQE